MTDLVGLLARLVAVFALLAVVLWLLKRTGGLQRRGTPLQVLSTTRLGKNATLSVVRVHGEEYVLGVSGTGVTVVTSRPADQPETAPGAPDPAGAAPSGAPPAGAAPSGAPPTAAEFLRSGWQVLRRRPVSATELSEADVAAAVATALAAPPSAGAAAPASAPVPVEGAVPQPRTSPDFAADLAAALKVSGSAADAEVVPEPALGAPGDAPSPTAADGSAARAARRDAGPRQESAWTAHRPPARTAVRARA